MDRYKYTFALVFTTAASLSIKKGTKDGKIQYGTLHCSADPSDSSTLCVDWGITTIRWIAVKFYTASPGPLSVTPTLFGDPLAKPTGQSFPWNISSTRWIVIKPLFKGSYSKMIKPITYLNFPSKHCNPVKIVMSPSMSSCLLQISQCYHPDKSN